MGKRTVIKILALLKLNHAIIDLSNQTLETIKYIKSLFYKFLWNGAPDKIKRSVISNSFECDGIRIIDLEIQMYTIK